MKKFTKTLLAAAALSTAIVGAMSFAACGNNDDGKEDKLAYKAATQTVDHWDNYTFDTYKAEDVTTKTVAYQFSDGKLNFEAGEDYGAITYNFMLNLYTDGFAKMIQYANLGEAGEDVIWYYGNWEYDEVINISLVWSEGTGYDENWQPVLSHHEDGFNCEAEISNGVMQATVPCDKYFNVFHDGSVAVSTDGTITYASFDAFKTAIKNA